MQALEVQVKNARLTFDEPTDLLDGAEVQVEIVVLDDEISPEERAALHASLDGALDDSKARPRNGRRRVFQAVSRPS